MTDESQEHDNMQKTDECAKIMKKVVEGVKRHKNADKCKKNIIAILVILIKKKYVIIFL